jgi:3-dehydroquinate dehydratase-1
VVIKRHLIAEIHDYAMDGNRICVSLGTNDIDALKKMIAESISANADFIEIRFDFFDRSLLNDVLEAVLDHRDRSIFTCRANSEGGKYQGSESDRVTTLRRLASFRPMLLDVEYNTMKQNEDLLDQFTALSCDVLVSWHDFEKTPTSDQLVNMMNAMKVYSNNVKIVTMANSLEDSISILKLYEHARSSNVNLVAFCMGEHGIVSRILCTYAGADFTYASLSEAVAPGQLTINQMRSIHRKLAEKPELVKYDGWKDRKNIDDILKIISTSKNQ